MPDLSHKAVHEFWQAYQDPTIYRVITFMEGVEDWTPDGNEALEASVKKLGEALDNLGSIEIGQEESIVELVGNLKTGRGLRLLMCLDMAYPGAAAKILMFAEESTKSEEDMSGIFLKRNIVFERLRLISRVFAKDRFQLITKALEESDHE